MSVTWVDWNCLYGKTEENIEDRIEYKTLNADHWFDSMSEKEKQRLRRDINKCHHLEMHPLIRCNFCKESLYISHRGGAPFFSHRRTDDIVLLKCPQRSESQSTIDDIRALKYMGQQESRRHIDLKNKISKYLLSDSSIDPQTVLQETRLTIEGEWRRPDVQAVHKNRLIAFEAQVSTEMASMIVAREYFYERFGHIIWVLPSLNVTNINQSVKDILVSNNDHLFVLDNEAEEESTKQKKLVLNCWIHWPYIADTTIEYQWESHLVSLDEIDFSDGRAMVKNVSDEERKLKKFVDQLSDKKINAKKETSLRNRRSYEKLGNPDKEEGPESDVDFFMCRWREAVEWFLNDDNVSALQREFALDDYCSELFYVWLKLHGISWHGLRISDFVYKALYSARSGDLVYENQNWTWLINAIHINQPKWYGAFIALARYQKNTSIINHIKNNEKLRSLHEKAKTNAERISEEERRFLALFYPSVVPDTEPPAYLGLYNCIEPSYWIYRSTSEQRIRCDAMPLYDHRDSLYSWWDDDHLEGRVNTHLLRSNPIAYELPNLPVRCSNSNEVKWFRMNSLVAQRYLGTWHERLEKLKSLQQKVSLACSQPVNW